MVKIKVVVYLKHNCIETYDTNSSLDYVLNHFKSKMVTSGMPLQLNENKYISNEILKVVITKDNLIYTMERNVDNAKS